LLHSAVVWGGDTKLSFLPSVGISEMGGPH
jgi:hypothetical protein